MIKSLLDTISRMTGARRAKWIAVAALGVMLGGMVSVGYFLATKQPLTDTAPENTRAQEAPSATPIVQSDDTIQETSPQVSRPGTIDDAPSDVKLQSLGSVHEAVQRYAECVTAIPFEVRRARMRNACGEERETLMSLMPSAEVDRLFEDMDEALAMHQPESALAAPTSTDPPHADAQPFDDMEAPMDPAQASQAHDAMQQYFDCVVGHPEFARSVEESQAGCLTERSAVAGYFSAKEARRILLDFDRALMQRWQNLEGEP